MSDYNYEIIKVSVMEWYEKVLLELKNRGEIILSKNSDDALIIDFDFQNCIAQLSVTNSQFVPYQFVYFEAMDIEEIKLIYCFYDDDTMQKVDVIGALDKALIFCLNYKVKQFWDLKLYEQKVLKMKIWKMMYDQSYDENIEIETSFKGEKAECGEKCDILSMGVKPILLPKAKDALYEVIKDDVQFIKLKHDKYGECYMLNVIKVLDCLDESKIRYTSTFSIKKYVFKENINYPSIFKITTDGNVGNFVTEPFMECVEKNKLKGLACGLIWDSERDI